MAERRSDKSKEKDSGAVPAKNTHDLGDHIELTVEDRSLMVAAFTAIQQAQLALGELEEEYLNRKAAVLQRLSQARADHAATARTLASKYGVDLSDRSKERWRFDDGVFTRIE